MKVSINARTIFNVFLLAFFALFTLMSMEYNSRARLIPMLFGTLGFAMVFLQLLHDAFPGTNYKLKFLKEEGIAFSGHAHSSTGNKPKGVKERDTNNWWLPARVFMWLIAFLIGLYFLDYLLAVPLFLFFFLWLEGGVKILPALAVSMGTGFFMGCLFEIILQSTL